MSALTQYMGASASGGDTNIAQNLIVNKSLIARELYLPNSGALTFSEAKDTGDGDSYAAADTQMRITGDGSSISLGKKGDEASQAGLKVSKLEALVSGADATRASMKNCYIEGELEFRTETGAQASGAIRFKERSGAGFLEMKSQANPLQSTRNQLVFRHSESQAVAALASPADDAVIDALYAVMVADKKGLYPHSQQGSYSPDDTFQLRAGEHADMIANEPGKAAGDSWKFHGTYEQSDAGNAAKGAGNVYIKLDVNQHAHIIDNAGARSAHDEDIVVLGGAAQGSGDYAAGDFYSGKLYKSWKQASPATTWAAGDLFTSDSKAMLSISDDEIRMGVNLYVDGTLTVTEGTAASFGDVANFARAVTMEDELRVTGHTRISNGQLRVQGSHGGVGLEVDQSSDLKGEVYGADRRFRMTNTELKISAANSGAALFQVDCADGDTDIKGTLDVALATECALTLGVDDDFRVGGTQYSDAKFTVDSDNGNTEVAGTLGADGDLRVGDSGTPNAFTVAAASGNTVIEGTADINGAVDIGASGDKVSHLKAFTTGNVQLDADGEMQLNGVAGGNLDAGSGTYSASTYSFSGVSTAAHLLLTQYGSGDDINGVPHSMQFRAEGAMLEVATSKDGVIGGDSKVQAGGLIQLKSTGTDVADKVRLEAKKDVELLSTTGRVWAKSTADEVAIDAGTRITVEAGSGDILLRSSSNATSSVQFHESLKSIILAIDDGGGGVGPYFKSAATIDDEAHNGMVEGQIYADENGLLRAYKLQTGSQIQY